MITHKLYESWRIGFPIHRKPFQILEHGGEPRGAKNRNGIFGVFVKIGVEIPLIHEVGFATDVKENPSKVMEFERSENRGIFCYRFLNYVTMFAYYLFSAGLGLNNDREAVISRRFRKDRTIAALLNLEISLLGDRHCGGLCPVGRTGSGRFYGLAGRQLRNLNLVRFGKSSFRFGTR